MKDRMVFYPAFWWLSFVVFMIVFKAHNPTQKAVFSLAVSISASETLCQYLDRHR
jgi:hypothetical protein